MHPVRPIAVSCGDPSGVGPDILLAAHWARDALSLPHFYCHGDPDQLAARAAKLRLDVTIRAVPDGAGAAESSGKALPVVPLNNRFVETPGSGNVENAAGIIEAIDRAVEDCVNGIASAVVTCPIAKKVLYDAGFTHPGHTEYLAELAERHTGKPCTPVMMIAGPELRTVPVTIHIPLAEVPEALDADLIVETIRITAHDLRTRFGLPNARISVAGLNPHAGEDGAIGREEIEKIIPAMERCRAEGIDVTGPLPADTMFHTAARATYDAAVCMYHDQALVPAKTLAFDDGVNVTLGLPFIRTSPDHGTAFGIAGSGKARPDSFIAALRLAAMMAANG